MQFIRTIHSVVETVREIGAQTEFTEYDEYGNQIPDVPDGQPKQDHVTLGKEEPGKKDRCFIDGKNEIL